MSEKLTYEENLIQRAEKIATALYPKTYQFAKKMETKHGSNPSWVTSYYKKQLAYMIEMAMPIAVLSLEWSEEDFERGYEHGFSNALMGGVPVQSCSTLKSVFGLVKIDQ